MVIDVEGTPFAEAEIDTGVLICAPLYARFIPAAADKDVADNVVLPEVSESARVIGFAYVPIIV